MMAHDRLPWGTNDFMAKMPQWGGPFLGSPPTGLQLSIGTGEDPHSSAGRAFPLLPHFWEQVLYQWSSRHGSLHLSTCSLFVCLGIFLSPRWFFLSSTCVHYSATVHRHPCPAIWSAGLETYQQLLKFQRKRTMERSQTRKWHWAHNTEENAPPPPPRRCHFAVPFQQTVYQNRFKIHTAADQENTGEGQSWSVNVIWNRSPSKKVYLTAKTEEKLYLETHTVEKTILQVLQPLTV